jgi:hypothetical protein
MDFLDAPPATEDNSRDSGDVLAELTISFATDKRR